LKYDKVLVLAKNKDGEVISACKFGCHWYFVYESKADGGRIGKHYNLKREILADARNFILNGCGYNFKESDLTKTCDEQQ